MKLCASTGLPCLVRNSHPSLASLLFRACLSSASRAIFGSLMVRRLCGVLGGYTWLRQTVRLTCSVPLVKSISSNLKAKHSPLP
jgi:hypothetical protein